MEKIILLFSLFFSISFYAQNDTVSDVKTRNISVVSAEKMNIVYRGLPNPISIAVPNCKSFKVIGKYLAKSADRSYNINPNFKVKETTVLVDIVLNDGTVVKEEHIFKVKEPPYVLTTINGNSYYTALQKDAFKDALLLTNYNSEDFVYGIEIEVKGFTADFISKKGKKINSIIVEGNSFNKECLAQINILKNGDYIIITDQKIASNYDFLCGLTSPLIVLIYDLPVLKD